MAVSTKKGSKSNKAKPSSTVEKKSRSSRPNQDRSLKSQLAEALDQQAGTSAILRIIARSPAELQLVLNTIAESAASLCNAADALVWRVARQRTFSRYWIQWRSVRRGSVTQSMHRFGALRVTEFDSLPSTGQSRVQGSKRAGRSSEVSREAERSWIERPSTFRTRSRHTFRLNFRKLGQ